MAAARRAGVVLPALLLVAVAGPVRVAGAEPFVDLYTGKSMTGNANVEIKQGTVGNDLTVRSLSFDDKSFEDPPWYGVRVGYFFESVPWLGVGLEFFHFKIIGDTGEVKQITGTRGGAPIDTRARVDSIVQQFQITHGVNYLMVDVLARYGFLEDDDAYPGGRIQLYAGVGAGPVIARAETIVEGVKREPGYQVASVGLQAFAGARVMLFKHLGLFVEGKVTYSRLTVGIARAGEARLNEASRHVVGGITIPFP